MFRSLQNLLNDVIVKQCKGHLSQFFMQKQQKFYSDEITPLSEETIEDYRIRIA